LARELNPQKKHTYKLSSRSVFELEKFSFRSFFPEWKWRRQRKAEFSPTVSYPSLSIYRFAVLSGQLSRSHPLGKYEKCWKNKTLSRTKHATRPANSWAALCCCARSLFRSLSHPLPLPLCT